MTFKYLSYYFLLLQDNFPRIMIFIEGRESEKNREKLYCGWNFSIKISSLFSHFWTILHKATPLNVNMVHTCIYIWNKFLCHEIIMIWGIFILLLLSLFFLFLYCCSTYVYSCFGGQKYFSKRKSKENSHQKQRKNTEHTAPAVEIIYLPTAIKSSLHVW